MTDRLGNVAVSERQWAQIVVGTAGLAIGVAAFATTWTDPVGIVTMARAATENDYLLVMGLGGLAVVLGALVVVDSRDSVRIRQTPTVERPMPAPTPGESFDGDVDRWRTLVPIVGRPASRRVQERLREAAVRVVALENDWSESKAATVVREGSWTDDPVAREFLAADGAPNDIESTLQALGNGETPLRYRARRTLAAIGDHREGDL